MNIIELIFKNINENYNDDDYNILANGIINDELVSSINYLELSEDQIAVVYDTLNNVTYNKGDINEVIQHVPSRTI